MEGVFGNEGLPCSGSPDPCTLTASLCVLVSRQSQKLQAVLYTLFVSLDVQPVLIHLVMLPFLQESPALPYGYSTSFLACTFLHLFPHPILAGSIVILPDHPASFQAWSTWRTGPVFLWTTTRLTRSSGGTHMRTSTPSVRRVQRGPGLSHPCPASTWRKVRTHKVFSGQSVHVEIPPTGDTGGQQSWGQVAADGSDVGHGMGEQDLVDFAFCHSARELRLFFSALSC